MTTEISPFAHHQLDRIVALSLAAWRPVFAEMAKAYLPEVFRAFYPHGWEARQREDVASACTSADHTVWVAQDGGAVTGFAVTRLHPEEAMGEVHMIAVDPASQGKGIGKALLEQCCNDLRRAGMTIVMVETGEDLGHAPARRLYRASGFAHLPVARYFRRL